MTKKQIIILGGGMGALSAAWYLTDKPNWKDEYESITLYQMGWRLGGKGASSRNMSRHCRSEEHGLHIWAGWYANAFAMLRACYDGLGRSIEPAFRGQDRVCLLDAEDGMTEPWSVRLDDFPDQFPGVDHPELSAWTLFQALLRVIARRFTDGLQLASSLTPTGPMPGWIRPDSNGRLAVSPAAEASPLQRALDLVERLAEREALSNPAAVEPVLPLLASFHNAVTRWLVGDPRHRRIRRSLDLLCSVATGMVADRVFWDGVSRLNDEEFRDWLRRHGAREETVTWAPVQLLYDSPFAYPGGDTSRPGNLAAGVALGVALRLGLGYRGHAFYDMAGGMGDVVIAPLYKALQQRGVRFEFFQQVKRLKLDAANRAITGVYFERQATVTSGRYEPLIDLNGLPCWPSTPLYEQLVEGDALKKDAIDLESHWSGWSGKEWELTVRQNDRVILGISLGALATICADLCEVNAPWRELIAGLPTVQTQSVQLWLNRPLHGTAWLPPGTWMATAPQPMSVLAEMTHVRESWTPASVHYLCGPLRGDYQRDFPPTVADTPARARLQVRDEARRWLETEAHKVWSDCGNSADGFDWGMLLDAEGATGAARLDSQYLRANINPSDRYVLSPQRTCHLRLPSNGSGFENLLLAGDWTRTALNIGCVEAAVMSGMAAAREIRGDGLPKINGEKFLQN